MINVEEVIDATVEALMVSLPTIILFYVLLFQMSSTPPKQCFCSREPERKFLTNSQEERTIRVKIWKVIKYKYAKTGDSAFSTSS
jgi:hypothetical protein